MTKLFLIAAVVCGCPLTTITYNHPAIEYSGRWDTTGTYPICSWTGCGFRFTTDATEVYMTAEEVQHAAPYDNDFAVYVNGTRTGIITPANGVNETEIASSLTGTNTIEVVKASSASRGYISMRSLRLVSATTFIRPTIRQRRIEIIGDSFACGSGNTGTPACTALDYQDGSLSYGHLAAVALNAEVSNICIPGVEAGDASLQTDFAATMGARTYFSLSTNAWAFATPADVYVVALGQNDGTPDADWQAGMDTLLDTIRTITSDAHIMLINGPSTTGDAAFTAAVSAIIVERNDGKIHQVEFAPMGSELGCASHPNTTIHARDALVLQAAIESATGW